MEDEGVPSRVLMENAGRGAALVLDRLFPSGPVVVVAGTGNNGGDGVVLARSLRRFGRDVSLLVLGERPRPDPLLHAWPVPVETVPDHDGALDAALARGAVLVDALLGTGVTGAPRARHARVIRAMNRSRRPILALDLPSGLDADSGAVAGEAIRADLTVAFGFPKVGTVLFPGRELSGRLIVIEIGFPPLPEGLSSARLLTSEWIASHRPRRPLVTHKKAEGRLLIAAGSPGMAGAAILSARAALRAGVGYVRVASPEENRTAVQSSVPEALFVDIAQDDALSDALADSDAVAAGPGLGAGSGAGERLNGLLSEVEGQAVLLDADALTHLGNGALPAFAGAGEGERRILTPHPGEAVRIGADPESLSGDVLGVARDLASRWNAAILLKGTPSIAAHPAGREVLVATSGSSDLARAGMGDVLTGAAGALLARGLKGWEASALALHFTGLAAMRSGAGESLLPTDVIEGLAGALREGDASTSGRLFPFVSLDLPPPH